jgi:hypothetical protein
MLIMSIKKLKLAKLSYVSLNHALMIDDIYSNGKTHKKFSSYVFDHYHYLN